MFRAAYAPPFSRRMIRTRCGQPAVNFSTTAAVSSVLPSSTTINSQFAKNLSCFGWRPIILTAQTCSEDRDDDIEHTDGTLDCPKITVKAPKLLVPFGVEYCTRFRLSQNGEGQSRLKPLYRFIAQLALPDGKIAWLRRAVNRTLEATQEYPIKMCFSVSPRPTAHLVARRIARALEVPWVADLALPWSDADWLSGRPRILKWLDQRLEASTLRTADHITVAYDDIARGLSARHGALMENKISVIPTGFSEDLFVEHHVPLAEKFRVVYPGNHFCDAGRHGDCFLAAVDEWIGSNPQLKDRVEFIFLGKRDEQLLRKRATMRHPEVVHLEPLIAHRKCVQTVLSSHLCVVNTVGNRIPDKVYECMRAGKLILALSESSSDLETLMRHYSKSISVPARDQSAVRAALQYAWQYRCFTNSGRIDAEPAIKRYSATMSATKIAGIFDRLLSASNLSVARSRVGR